MSEDYDYAADFHAEEVCDFKEEIANLKAASRDLLEVAKEVANLPCSTTGLEDMESGCCLSCRARAAIAKTMV